MHGGEAVMYVVYQLGTKLILTLYFVISNAAKRSAVKEKPQQTYFGRQKP